MENIKESFDIVVKTFYGLESVLTKELEEMDVKNVVVKNRAVQFKGNNYLLYKLNYNLRTAISVLKPIFEFTAQNEDSLYQQIYNFDWSVFLDVKRTFAIENAVNSTIFKHSQFAALKVKDAIVDQFRDRTGKRPFVDTENPDLLINLYIAEDKCIISLNSSGEPLFKRGYRTQTDIAPLNEVLAAGLIKLSGWEGKTNIIDPMCGSGTIPIEAALMAYHVPPGIFRNQFGFEKWNDFEQSLFDDVIDDVIDTKDFAYQIIGSDVSVKAVNITKANIKNASLTSRIHVINSSFEDLEPSFDSGLIIMNPPYGERIKEDGLFELYKNIGDTLKKKYSGYECWIFSCNLDAIYNIHLHPSRRITLFNGALEGKYQCYRMYKGIKEIMTGTN